MSNLSVVLATANTVSRWGDTLPVPLSVPKATQNLATGASSTVSSITNSAAISDVWILTANGGNVWVKFGANPTAAAGSDWLIMNGQTREFGVTEDGEKLAAIDG